MFVVVVSVQVMVIDVAVCMVALRLLGGLGTASIILRINGYLMYHNNNQLLKCISTCCHCCCLFCFNDLVVERERSNFFLTI